MNLWRFRTGLFSLLSLFVSSVYAQDEPPKTSFQGYVKYLQTLDVTDGFDSLLDNHLIHNRLNFSWFPSERWAVRGELRNRIFYGDFVDGLPFFKSLVDVNNDQIDMSAWLIDKRSLKFLTELDRAYVRYTSNNWEITGGRQRINWGINTVWNPNDIFNAYSFFDFDYEERPGSDALRVVYNYGFASRLEFASKFSTNIEDFTGALLWKFNRQGYDVQLLGGLMDNNVVVGTGWAGNIKSAGFKGEVSYFSALDASQDDALVTSVSGDYVLNDGTYLLLSYFYNSNGARELDLSNLALVSSTRPLNAKNLLPFESAIFLQVSKPFGPLITASLSTMVFPTNSSMFVGPTLTYSASNSVTLDFISQIFTIPDEGFFQPASSQIFLRAKWSF